MNTRRALAFLSLTALFAAGCRPKATSPEVRPPTDDAGPVHISVAPAVGREVPLTLATTGTLVPGQQSEVTPIVPGRVTEVLVERGSHVHAGDPMIRLRDADYRSNASSASAVLSQARARLGLDGQTGPFNPENTAEVRAARANRDLAEDALRRAQQLASSGAMSDQELQRATAQATAAREQYQSAVNGVRGAYFAYQQAQVSVSMANRSVSDSVIRAPFDGEVAERRANVGEFVSAQRAVVTLVATDPLRMEIQVPQDRIAFLRVNQTVDITTDAYPNQVFHGTVRYISAAVRAETRSLVAEAVVPNAEGTLRPGLFASARIDLGQRRQVVVVPSRAVLSISGTNRVFVLEGDHVQERVVNITERHGDEMLIERNVNAGDRLAVEALDRLSDGARVAL